MPSGRRALSASRSAAIFFASRLRRSRVSPSLAARSPSPSQPMSPDCIFCRIANREIPSDIVLETAQTLAFRDLNPQAPVHVLVIPRTHVSSLAEATDAALLSNVLSSAAQVAREE